jgi:predicted ATP-grasp superfamily ATP-dependent carboligase
MVDTPISAALIAKGKMSITDYFRSWKGKKTFAVLSLKDPLPFLVELLLVPYIMKKRGI